MFINNHKEGGYKMLKTERQEMILETLQNCRHTTAAALCEQLFVSYSSIRRDLEELENMGLVRRSYGRVELAGRNPLLVSYPIRINKNAEQKRIIASKAARLIKEGDTLFIDPSSSCSFFAREILHMKGITVITNNVEVINIMTQSGINVICSGGLQTEPNRYALTGPIAESTFRNIHADWAVFSVRSLTNNGKLYDVHYSETALRKVMLENAAKSLFLCDGSKLGTDSPYYQCSLKDVDYMVCNSKEAKKYLKDFPGLKLL